MQEKVEEKVNASGKDAFYEEIFSTLTAALSALGLDQFAYYSLPREGAVQPEIISNFPREYYERYRAEKLYRIDSVIETARHRVTPFAWDTDVTMGDDCSNIFDIAKHYRINAGYTFVVHDHLGSMGTLHICNHSNDAETFNRLITKNRAHLQMQLLDTHERYVAHFGTSGFLFARDLHNPLSERENEVLHWASIGKTYEEIAVILNISERTVKFHMRNVVSKLKAVNAKHAIKKASDMHLLAEQPT